MNVRVQHCFKGHNNYTFQLTFMVDGNWYRESVRGESWSRSVAGQAKDKIAYNYGVQRKNIRFI